MSLEKLRKEKLSEEFFRRLEEFSRGLSEEIEKRILSEEAEEEHKIMHGDPSKPVPHEVMEMEEQTWRDRPPLL